MADVPGAAWDHVVQVNLLGTAAVVRAALPALQASRGRIVTVASTLGLRALSDASAYCASKFGVVGLTRALATELQGQVGVTLLLPGGMDTAFFDGRTEQYKPGPTAMLNDPTEVAEAVLFALSRPAGLRGARAPHHAVGGALVAVSGPDALEVAAGIARAAPRVLVVGDAVLDGWVSGPAHRIGRDGPVPVVEQTDTRTAPGGAAGTAAALAALGATVELVAVLGDDHDGRVLRRALAAAGVRTHRCVLDPARPTAAKRRVLAGEPPELPVARFDVTPPPPGPAVARAVADQVGLALADGVDAVLVSDYGLGCAAEPVRAACSRAVGRSSRSSSSTRTTSRTGRSCVPTPSPRASPRPPRCWASPCPAVTAWAGPRTGTTGSSRRPVGRTWSSRSTSTACSGCPPTGRPRTA